MSDAMNHLLDTAMGRNRQEEWRQAGVKKILGMMGPAEPEKMPDHMDERAKAIAFVVDEIRKGD